MRKCIWILVLATCLALSAVTVSQAQTRNLEIYWIDVEGGAATLIVTPSGQSLLVDQYALHAGERDAAWWFEALGVRQGSERVCARGLHGRAARDGEVLGQRCHAMRF